MGKHRRALTLPLLPTLGLWAGNLGSSGSDRNAQPVSPGLGRFHSDFNFPTGQCSAWKACPASRIDHSNMATKEISPQFFVHHIWFADFTLCSKLGGCCADGFNHNTVLLSVPLLPGLPKAGVTSGKTQLGISTWSMLVLTPGENCEFVSLLVFMPSVTPLYTAVQMEVSREVLLLEGFVVSFGNHLYHLTQLYWSLRASLTDTLGYE